MRRAILRLTTTAVLCVGAGLAGGQAAPPQAAAAQGAAAQARAPMAEEVFKNIQVLKGIPADEFMDTMGMFSAATTKDCTGCHVPEIMTDRAALAKPTPMIYRARQMVIMMNTINRNYFGGRPVVTCYTCHSASDIPDPFPNLSIQYGELPEPNPNTTEIIAIPEYVDRVDAIFAKFVDALGGAARIGGITSLVASGTYAGWDTALSEVPAEMFARAPEQLTTVVHRNEGDNIWVLNGQNAWFAGVDATVPNFAMPYTGGNLFGARIDALVAIAPGRLRQVFSKWQVGADAIGDTPVTVLQGSNDGQLPVNFFFDDSGLLVRMVRWSQTAVGAIPTQYDYEEYREVAGIRRPFQVTKTWTNNRVVFRWKEIRLNVPVDAARFARPAPVPLSGAGR